MQAALARIRLPELPPLHEVLRAGVVAACALALILAGPLLPL